MESKSPKSTYMVSLRTISYIRITVLISYLEDITSAPSEASEVTEINGVDAVKYVEDWIFQASFNQDADSAYNTMFYEKAFVAGGKHSSSHALYNCYISLIMLTILTRCFQGVFRIWWSNSIHLSRRKYYLRLRKWYNFSYRELCQCERRLHWCH